jgi:hypothetical protein
MVVDQIHTQSAVFARHHRLELPAGGAELTIDDARTTDGGYGDIHPVRELDGTQPARPMLAKIFKPEPLKDLPGGAATLAERVRRLHRVLERRGDTDWRDALLALPYSVATAEVGGNRRLVAFMLDLEPLGYGPAPLTRDLGADDYVKRDLDDLIDLALRYAERAALLEEIPFLHGDQNPENLMFNLATLDVQIIDLDTGVVLEDGSERPLSPGKLDNCMPPEVKETGVFDEATMRKYTAEAERWSVGSLVGMAIFVNHPGFFLRAIASRTLDEYAAAGYRWPDVDPDGPLFGDPLNKPRYAAFKQALDTLPGGIVDLFGDLFAAGTDGARRPRARDWVEAIAATRVPPVFEFVTLDSDLVLEGSEVVLSWAATNAERVESRELGTLAPAGSVQAVVDRATAFSLTAVNRYGRVEMRSPVVRVVPLPRFERIPAVPAPELRLTGTVSVTSPPPTIPRLAPPRVVDVASIPPAPVIARNLAPPRVPVPPLPAFSSLVGSLFAGLDGRDGKETG